MRSHAPFAVVTAMTMAIGLALALVPAAPVTVAAAVPAGLQTAAVQTVPEPIPDGVTRLSGASRYETAVAVSRLHAPGVPVAFVASGADFPDALAGASAAALAGGPLLLTQPTQLPSVVLDELRRLAPARIVLIGGVGAVAAGVQSALHRVAPTTRLAGVDRYATGLAIVRSTFTTSDHAIIATGRAFPDALAATGAAGSRGAPIVLVDGTRPTVSTATLAQLARLGVRSVSIAGGPGAVSNAIHSQLSASGYDVTRYGGTTRYDTAALINRAYFAPGSSRTTFLATGLDFPDAIAGAALAGQLAAPINVTPRGCVHPAVSDTMTALGATSRVVLGGTGAVSETAANAARCVYPNTGEPLANWATSRWRLAGDVVPFADRPPVDVYSPSVVLDSTGLRIYRRVDNNQRADHPVVYAQYGLSALIEFDRTGDPLWLERAVRHGEKLIEMHVERDGAWWYPYPFRWTYIQRTLAAPWWSMMAQGEALSLFSRLATETGEPHWFTAADRTWESFPQQYTKTGPWGSLAIDGHLYFEGFAATNQPPLLVANTHIFAMFGLYDYWRLTGNAEAARYFDGGASTVLARIMPLVRVEGEVMYYCVQAEYCQSPSWQNQHYHPIFVWQLQTLADITGDARFAEWSSLLNADWQPTAFERAQGSDFEPGVEPLEMGAVPGLIEP
ncbi:cell wall-binding repeat-containing protein [Agromyces sp. SYSU K20354]|uniref:cell wall-binding repeat-containing protein n=1 Tax=Agromyces cavernae TaxID=2898659 RepID=UPI001E2DA2BA|nr:cell wall-binding repeat-containing protein [Agromyces cavernae]MCD2444058.1 cell wall-binding repeat-containing protein [Agromyces cavernae]